MRQPDQVLHLAVSLKALVAEQRIIAKEEAKARCILRRARTAAHHKARVVVTLTGLQVRRRVENRRRARLLHLAYGFLRGVPYRAMESVCYEAPSFAKLCQTIKAYSPADRSLVAVEMDVRCWLDSRKGPFDQIGDMVSVTHDFTQVVIDPLSSMIAAE